MVNCCLLIGLYVFAILKSSSSITSTYLCLSVYWRLALVDQHIALAGIFNLGGSTSAIALPPTVHVNPYMYV